MVTTNNRLCNTKITLEYRNVFGLTTQLRDNTMQYINQKP